MSSCLQPNDCVNVMAHCYWDYDKGRVNVMAHCYWDYDKGRVNT